MSQQITIIQPQKQFSLINKDVKKITSNENFEYNPEILELDDKDTPE